MRAFTSLILLIVAGPSFSEPTLAPRIDEYMAPYVDTRNFQGVILIARGNEIVVEKAYGMASLEHGVKNQPETVFHVASVSKPFTATAIMQLAEAGKIDIHAPLVEVLPDYPAASQLAIHHLLAHTSGVPNINTFDQYSELERHTQTTTTLVEQFRDMPLQFEPGERYDYSNSNYNLLALIIERVSGQSYGDYLSEHLFAPAGMTATDHDDDPGSIIKNLAVGYEPVGHSDLGRARWLDWTVKTGNGSLVSTTHDLQRWVQAFFSDRVLDSDLKTVMLTEHTDNVGYGWFIRPRNGRTQYHINGRSPGFSSYVGYYPQQDITVIVLANIYNSITTSIGADLAAIYFGEPYAVPKLTVNPVPNTVIDGIVGQYQFGSDFYNPDVIVEVQNRGGNLFLVWGDGSFETAQIYKGGNRFRDRAFWSDVEFVRDMSGEGVEILFDGFSGCRIRQ